MSEQLKNFLNRELEELKQNKIRAIALGITFVLTIIFWMSDNISTTDNSVDISEPNTIKDPPPKTLPDEIISEGITLVMGANPEPLMISDPFEITKKSPPPRSQQSQLQQEQLPQIPKMTLLPFPGQFEKTILTGTELLTVQIKLRCFNAER